MNELTLDGKVYISSKRAAEITGYAKDYVGQLCREGRVEARLVGRNWYILKSAIEKHRFTPEKVIEVSETIEDSAAPGWSKLQYKAEDLEALPSIAKEGEEPALADQTTMEAMQDAWRGWFTRTTVSDELPELQENVEIAQEATEEPIDDEVAIPLQYVREEMPQPEALNLRRIREYQPEEPLEEEIIVSENRPRERDRAGSYRVLQAAFVLISVLALAVGYIGAGFLNESAYSYKPASVIAGVSTYNIDK